MLFTYRSLLALKPEPADVAAGRYVEHFATGSDEKAPGLAIRVAPSGLKTFTFHFTFEGKRARMGLGRFPDLPLEDARNRVMAARQALAADPPRDPREDVRAAEAAASLTLSQVVEQYLADPDVAKLRTQVSIARTLRNTFAKHIGDVAVSDLTRQDLAKCVNRVRQRGAMVYAAQCHKNMRLCFEWAVKVAAIMEANPMRDIAAPALPKTTGAKIRPLNDEGEIAAFWNGIHDVLPEGFKVYARILKLALLTGCRLSEVAEIQPGEIANGVLTIPPSRTKNKKAHAIPLNAAMLELLGNDLANPWGKVNGKPVKGQRISDMFSDRDLSNALGSTRGYNVHSLRRTLATGLEELGFPGSTISLCLNHSPKREERPDEGAAITRRYIQNSATVAQRKAEARMELKRQAFDEWTRCVLVTAAG